MKSCILGVGIALLCFGGVAVRAGDDPAKTPVRLFLLSGQSNMVGIQSQAQAAAASPIAAVEGDKIRILFVANSYSHWNHLPRLLEEFIAVGQKRQADVMPWTSAGAPLGWHLKDGRAIKWLTGDTKEFVAGAEQRVTRLRDQIAKSPDQAEAYVGPYKIKWKDQLREHEVQLAQAKDPRWDFVFLLFFTDDYAVDEDEISQRIKTFVDAARRHRVQPIVWLPWGGTKNVARYARIAGDLKAPVVATSFAEQLWKKGKLAEETPVRWGGGHPDARTSYLYACMFYGAMFDQSPEGLAVRKLRGYSAKDESVELSVEEALALQRAAWQALQECRKLAGPVSAK